MRRGLAMVAALTVGVGELALPAFEAAPAVASVVTEDEVHLYTPDPMEFLNNPHPDVIPDTAIKSLYERGLDIRRRIINEEDIAIDDGVRVDSYLRCEGDESDHWTRIFWTTGLIVEKVEIDGQEELYYFEPQLSGDEGQRIEQGDFSFNVYPKSIGGQFHSASPWLYLLDTTSAGEVRTVRVSNTEWTEDNFFIGWGRFSLLANDGTVLGGGEGVSTEYREACIDYDINTDGRIGFVLDEFLD